MKYVVTMNGKQYEVEVERMSAFHQLTREEIASGVSTPVTPLRNSFFEKLDCRNVIRISASGFPFPTFPVKCADP